MVRIRNIAGALLSVLALTLAAGVAAAGASSAASRSVASRAAATASALTGKIVDVGSNWFTVQTNGSQVGVVNALIRSANAVTNQDTPYVWGGGHAQAGVASIGIKGPGYNGKTKGYDCSGSVAAVLAGAGLWPAGAGVPADNGVISELMSAGLIARGVGSGPNAVDLYDDPGVHIFMSIDGRFFGTSDGGGGGDAAGGAGWLDDGAYDATDSAFKRYHFLPSVLKQSTSYGSDTTFQLASSGLFAATEKNLSISLGSLPISDLLANEKVRVAYTTATSGILNVQSIAIISGGPSLTVPTGTTTTGTTAGTTTGTTTTGTTTTPAPTGTPVYTNPTPTSTTPTNPAPGPGWFNSDEGSSGGAGFGSESATGSGTTGGAAAG